MTAARPQARSENVSSADGVALLRAALFVLDEAIANAITRDRDGVADADPSLRGLVITAPEVDALLRSRRRPASSQQTISESESVAGRVWGRIEGAVGALRVLEKAPPIELLRQRFGLGTFELECLIACLAPEIDSRYERLFGFLNDDVTRRTPSVQLLLRLLTPNGVDPIQYRRYLAADSTLLRSGLLAPAVDGRGLASGSALTRCLRAESAVVRFLLEEPGLDPEIEDIWYEPSWPAASARLWARSAATNSVDSVVAKHIEADARLRVPLVCVLRGRAGSGRLDAARRACSTRGLGVLAVDSSRLLRVSQPEVTLRRLFRDSLLYTAPLYFAEADTLLEDRDRGPDIRALIEHLVRERGWMVFIAVERVDATTAWLTRLATNEVAFSLPSVRERATQWRELLADGQASAADAKELDAIGEEVAPKFRLTAGQIAHVAELASRHRATDDTTALRDAVHAHAARVASPTLGDLAQRVTPRFDWDDLVLPDRKAELLRDVVRHVRFRRTVVEEWRLRRSGEQGDGVVALFFGEPGTGKSMAAQVLAGVLGMDLFRIDLSTVVSKYIGETEKNLARIFREAEQSDAILFFDEADALFGKRSEVRDAHDRYANIEINYLLQRMEQYSGVALLATNQRQSLDEAFLRRIHVAIEFPMPSPADRLRIWEKALPASAPRASDVDLSFLARAFELSGGNIHNIAVAAAMLAASENSEIAMEHLVLATHRELEKIGKRGVREEFGEYYAFVERVNGRSPNGNHRMLAR